MTYPCRWCNATKSHLAKDCKCSDCGQPAVVFVGLNDPDVEDEFPKCEKHRQEWRMRVLMSIDDIFNPIAETKKI